MYLSQVLLILATVFIYQIEGKPSNALDSLEKRIQENIQFLTDYGNNLAANGDKKFEDVSDKKKNEILTHVQETLQGIREKVEQAHEEGHVDPERCYESAQERLEKAENRIVFVVQSCYITNRPKWSHFHEQVKVHIQTGEKLLERINEIRNECASELSQPELCITSKLPKVAASAALFKVNMKKMETVVNVATAGGLTTSAVCSGIPLGLFKINVKAVVRIAEKCINSS